MFNLKKLSSTSEISDADLLLRELSCFDICKVDGGYDLLVGETILFCKTLNECLIHVNDGAEELKKVLWHSWQELDTLIQLILETEHPNKNDLQNVLFLSNVKKSYLLSKRFSELEHISNYLVQLLNIDIAGIHNDLVLKFNTKYIEIRCLHRLVLIEMYRSDLLKSYMRLIKTAQISGPWSNVDLPMAERVYPWDDGEESYMDDRSRSKKEQTRYNPEYDKNGFYFVWQEKNNGPYSFYDRDTESPYKSNTYLSIP